MDKFYSLKGMTKEDLNELVLERNILKRENQSLKEEIEKLKQPTIFIDTQDMEERYGESLYMDYLKQENQSLKEEKKRLLEIAKKMHLYIFLNTTDEQKAYDEIGLTDEENAMLGYSGEFILKGDK